MILQRKIIIRRRKLLSVCLVGLFNALLVFFLVQQLLKLSLTSANFDISVLLFILYGLNCYLNFTLCQTSYSYKIKLFFIFLFLSCSVAFVKLFFTIRIEVRALLLLLLNVGNVFKYQLSCYYPCKTLVNSTFENKKTIL